MAKRVPTRGPKSEKEFKGPYTLPAIHWYVAKIQTGLLEVYFRRKAIPQNVRVKLNDLIREIRRESVDIKPCPDGLIRCPNGTCQPLCDAASFDGPPSR